MMHSVIIVKFLSSTYLVTILKALHPPMTSVYNIYIPYHIHISYICISIWHLLMYCKPHWSRFYKSCDGIKSASSVTLNQHLKIALSNSVQLNKCRYALYLIQTHHWNILIHIKISYFRWRLRYLSSKYLVLILKHVW